MCSCIFRILFRVHEIFCMNIRRVLYHPAGKWGKRGERGDYQKFQKWLEKTNLWKSLWRV